MQRIESSDNITDVIERIVGRGIVVDPWASVCLADPDRMHHYRWTADCRIESGACEFKRVA